MDDHEILKQVLISSDSCFAHCKYSYMKDTYYLCDEEEHCKDHSMYEIDYKKLFDDYNIKDKEGE